MGMQENMEEARIRRVGVLSVANISGLINAFIGLLAGIVLLIINFIFPPSTGTGLLAGTSSAFPIYLLIFLLPVGNGVIGFLAGMLGAFLYNLAAKVTQGIKLYS